jgi:hypothetical protein
MTRFRDLHAFVRSTAGRGILAAYLAAVLLVFPFLLSWLVAIGLLLFALDQLWLLLRRVESQKPASPPVHKPEIVGRVSDSDTPYPQLDVEAALRAAQPPDRATTPAKGRHPDTPDDVDVEAVLRAAQASDRRSTSSQNGRPVV